MYNTMADNTIAETEAESENVTICITPTCTPSSPTDPDPLYELWESIMLATEAADSLYEALKQQTVKSLVHFAHYYGLSCPKGKTNKDILIDMICNFETNPANQAIVTQRQHLWQSLMALKADPYFSKFVLSNLLT